MWTPSFTRDPRVEVSDPHNVARRVKQTWLTAELFESQPLAAPLSGFPVEYKAIQLYSRDRGRNSEEFHFATAQDHMAFYRARYVVRRGILLDFDCVPSRDVTLRVRDHDGQGCVASLTIKDSLGRVYPLQGMRLAPDMRFQQHIYRADGESVRLPDGEYTVESKRGPEYLRRTQVVKIGEGRAEIHVRLQRWIDPAKWGWYSGDTHIHASGCAHYQVPTEGVSPETVIRHVRGEGLSIGGVLTWGPAWYYQKRFFTARAESPVAALEHPELQTASNVHLNPQVTPRDSESLLRYDIEVSGFPSSHCGHVVLLGLKEQDYPGTKVISDWPSWNLPILRWARAQGAVVGYAHSGSGMIVDSNELPNYEIPPMDEVGTQEGIVDVTHGMVDFLSGCDTKPVAELNALYHMLNCGFRVALIGETDYPCIDGERPGVGRSYVRLEKRPTDDQGYVAWLRGLKRGQLYCGDGRSHLLDFTVNGCRSGDPDLVIDTSSILNVEALVAAWLEPVPPADMEPIRHQGFAWENGWHLENARIAGTREVAVGLVLNGVEVQRVNVVADGNPRAIRFRIAVERSSWIALRIMPSSHSHPVFVQVGAKPIRASRRSAQWCRACVDKVWEVKSPFMRDSERPAAAAAFDHARSTYDAIAAECEVD
jgi:hypothetical protein